MTSNKDFFPFLITTQIRILLRIWIHNFFSDFLFDFSFELLFSIPYYNATSKLSFLLRIRIRSLVSHFSLKLEIVVEQEVKTELWSQTKLRSWKQSFKANLDKKMETKLSFLLIIGIRIWSFVSHSNWIQIQIWTKSSQFQFE